MFQLAWDKKRVSTLNAVSTTVLNLCTAPSLLIYRRDPIDLEEACALLGTHLEVFGEQIAWNLWLECLPINNLRLLQSSNVIKFAERRCNLDSESVMG